MSGPASPTVAHPLGELLAQAGLREHFSAQVEAEVEALLAAPGIDDPALVDLTALPFVTIDGPTSRDLDQALFLERVATRPAAPVDGYRVHYALADAAHFVPSSSALFAEALERGTSFYLPGWSVPMLPRALSEGLVSLNEGVDRRALVLSTTLDRAGAIVGTEVTRARIRSRKKLAFDEVQRLYDAPESSPLCQAPFAESLALLRTVGELRIALGDRADVVRYHRREVEVSVGQRTGAVVVVEAVRDRVELYNEQLSLLCNREGGRLLAESPDPRLQPIYRVHPAPQPERLAELRRLLGSLVRAQGLSEERWGWRADEPLGAFLRRLPSEESTLRIARAMERQALLVNLRSALSTEPAAHFGVGAEVYARFSAPMREVVGIFLHKELLEHAGLAPPGETQVDEALRSRVVESANAARERQRALNDAVNRLALDALLRPDLSQTPRPRRRGTVMGLTTAKLHVELDAPGVGVKVYLRDLGRTRGGAWLVVTDEGVTLAERDTGRVICRMGDAVDVVTLGFDEAQDRWRFDVARVE